MELSVALGLLRPFSRLFFVCIFLYIASEKGFYYSKSRLFYGV
jgi:hypothetical protein